MAQNIFSQLAQQTLSTATTPAGGGAAGDDDPTSAITAVAQEHGVNPNFLLGLAQLETRGGKATVKGQGVDSRNLFNIKDFSKAGTGIRALDKAEGSNHPYRRYDSASDSARDLVRLLGSKRYEGALTAQTPEEFAAALKRGRYATDPDYERKLASTIKSVQAKGGAPAPAPVEQWDQGARYVPMEHMVPGGPPARNPNKNPDFLRGAGDVGLSFLQGAAGSVKSLTDLAGAGNAVSRVLDDTSKELGKLKSEEARQSLAYHQQKIKDAETNGDWKQEIGAYADMVWDMPADSLAQALGSLVTLGVGKAAQVVKLASSARRAGMTKEAFLKTAQGVEAAKKASNLGAGVNLGLGVGQGVGGVKGEQYERTYNAAKEEGLADDEAQALATEAQSYGKGWMQQAAGAALGYAAAKTGPLEKLASGQTVGAGGVLRRLAGGAGIEGVSEGTQGAQARYAGNTAAIDAGVLDESQRFAGVAGTAFSEGWLGGMVGGGAGALGRPDVDPLATTKEAAKKPNSPISRAAVAGQPAEQNSEESAADPFFKGMSDETLLLIQRHLQARQAAGDEDIDDDDTEMAQAAKAEYERRMAAKPPPPPGLGYNPDPLIVFPDGTAGRKGEMERYVASLPEEKRNEARAKLYGYAPQPTNSPPPAVPAQPAGVFVSEEVQPAPAEAKPAITVDLNPAPRAPSPFDAVPMEQDPAITQQQREDAAKAQERRSKMRLGVYNKNPMMEFLGRHGLQPETQNEFAPGTAERRKATVFGYGPVFRQNGKPLDLLLSNAKDEGFLPPEASESDLYDLVARAINGERVDPLYKAGSADALMQRLAAEREAKEAASYEDFLAQQQALAADPDYDPFATFADTENDYDVSDLDNSGYSQAEKSLQAEVSALAQAYSQLGFDADDVLEPLAIQYESNPDEYYAQARQRLTQLIAQATQPRGNDNLPQDSGEQTQAPIGREAASATSADDDALIDYAAEDDGEPDYFLQAQTARQLREREEAIAEQARLNAERKQALEAKAQADDERKRIAQASVQAADTFELGQNALDNLTGQTDLLAQMPTAQAESPAPAATQAAAKSNNSLSGTEQEINQLEQAIASIKKSEQANLSQNQQTPVLQQMQDIREKLNSIYATRSAKEIQDMIDDGETSEVDLQYAREKLNSSVELQDKIVKDHRIQGKVNNYIKLQSQLEAATGGPRKKDASEQLRILRESDAATQELVDMGYTQSQLGAILSGAVSAEDFDRQVKDGYYHREYGARDSFFAKKDKQAAAQPQDGDILSDNGKPFTFEYGAKLRAKKEGGEVVQVAGGWAVRPTQGEAMQADPVAGDKIDDEWTAFSEQSGTLGIPRAEMPQVKAQDRGAMVNFLKARGIDSSNEVMPARAIKPTQAEFSPAKVQEAAARTDGNRSIIVSADGYVVDGHHQWMAQRQKGEPVKVIKLYQPIGDVLQALKEMPSAQPEQAATQPEAQDAIRTNEGTTTPAGLPKGVPATFNNPSDVPPQPGVYRMRDGTFARFDHGIWWRSQPTAKEALLTEFSGEDQMSPENRYSTELAWAPYATISGRDAFGEASAMRRIPAKPAEEISPDHLQAAGVRWEAMDAAQRKDVARASGLSDTVKPKAPQQVWSNFTPEMQQHLYRSMSEMVQSRPVANEDNLPEQQAQAPASQTTVDPVPQQPRPAGWERNYGAAKTVAESLGIAPRGDDGKLKKVPQLVADIKTLDATQGQASSVTSAIDTSPAAKWRNNWGEAKRTAEILGLPIKNADGRNLRLPQMVPAIEAKLARQQMAAAAPDSTQAPQQTDTPLGRAETELADWKERRDLPANTGNVADVPQGNPTAAMGTEAEPSNPFGPILTQYRYDAQGAIKALTELKSGEAVAALHHPEVGDIDLVWGKAPEGGTDGFGLAKLVKKHPEVLQDLQGFLDRLHKDPKQSGKNRIRLIDNRGTAVVRLQWEGKSKKWLLTAFENETPGATTRTDIGSLAIKDDTASLEAGGGQSLPTGPQLSNTLAESASEPAFPEQSELNEKREALGEREKELEAESKANEAAQGQSNDVPIEGATAFSRRTASGNQLPTAQVEAVVRQLQSGWSNAPAVVVAQDLQDPRVPQVVRDENARQVAAGAEGAPEGFIHGETVYLVASQMGSPADAARVLLHEVVGHYGLRGVFGDTLSPILRDLANKRRRNVVEMAVRYGLVPDGTATDASVADIYQAMTPAQREQAAEEVLAYMAQNQPELGFVQRAIAAIRQWLKSTFPTLGERLALLDSDIVANYITPARAFVEGGRPRVQAHRTAKAQSNLMDVLAALDESGVVDINC